MERLVFETQYGNTVDEDCIDKPSDNKFNGYTGRAVDRLAEYENTFLTPAEIANLVEAYTRVRADRDNWKREALKATAQLGEIRILMAKTFSPSPTGVL